jgi:hypothetical protein
MSDKGSTLRVRFHGRVFLVSNPAPLISQARNKGGPQR